MKLIEILKNRVSDNRFDSKICGWLYNRAEDIVSKTSAHLKYVRNVLDEFDKHSAEHSKRVLEIIEDLLGDRAENLSSYDLFSLIAVAYLHDCGMAVSDYEVRVMNLVENGDYDGKKVFDTDEALEIIKGNRNRIFETDRDAEDIKKWLFYPGSEQKLFEYYAQLLIDYQTFRNGKIDKIQESKDLNKTNKELRLELIRRTHADRVETYIGTWGEKEIADFNDNQPEGEHLFNNIAMACKAHGEDANFIKKELDKSVGYLGNETSNLQFVAMMLRIGDIVHFTYDRAPVVLRALHHFESADSYEQWRIKTDSGVNFDVTDGTISCKAYCKNPKDYYNLTTYIDYIDNELGLYNRLKYEEEWETPYPKMTRNVNRDSFRYDKKLFIPVPNLKFTLEQNRILDLLMGAELYSDEYACLRELYQNSLDACRCQMARGQSSGKIEFGLKTDNDGNRYVYCLDNGKGMSKHIIENYLLKIGSSYYKSSEFYQSQAETGNTFTPTSQFGIGILSCFMIGDKLEITTREFGGEYTSCVMENIHECFYYKMPSQSDKSAILNSGTLIKIYLNEKYKDKMSNENLENIGYLLWKNENTKKHSDHLYFILDDFVKIVPDKINLNVRFSDGEVLGIFDKPQPLGKGIWTPDKEDEDYEDNYIENAAFLYLDVECDGILYRSYIVLPKEEGRSYYARYKNVLLGGKVYCVDGIKVDNSFVKGHFLEMTKNWNGTSVGIICFMGSERPQLSISREKIVNYEPDKYEEKIKGVLSKLVNQAIDKMADYIILNHVNPSSDFYYEIWLSFLQRFQDLDNDFFEQHLIKREAIKDIIMPFPRGFTTNQMTFGEFLGETVRLENYSFYPSLMNCHIYLRDIIKNRIDFSRNISFDGSNVIINGYQNDKTSRNSFVPSEDGLFHDYDIVTSLYPFVSYSLFANSKVCDSIYDYAMYFLELIVGNSSHDDIRESQIFDFAELSRINGDYTDYYSFLSKFINENHLLFFNYHNRMINRRYFERNIGYTLYFPFTIEQVNKKFKQLYRYVKDGDRTYKGLSMVLFGQSGLFYVVPGCWSRQELMDKVPDEIWNSLRSRYYFTDGTVVRRNQF